MSMTDWQVSARWNYPVSPAERFNVAKREPGATTRIIEEVARKWGLEARDLTGPNRTKYVAWARFEAMYRVRMECPWMSLPQIAVRLGGRDHTTVLHGVRRYQELTENGKLDKLRAKGQWA